MGLFAVSVNPGIAAAFWSLVAAIGVLVYAFTHLELKGVRDKAKGDTFSETWWWLRDNVFPVFLALMVALVLLLFAALAVVVEGFRWLLPHFWSGGH
jgi:hypothetical protein